MKSTSFAVLLTTLEHLDGGRSGRGVGAWTGGGGAGGGMGGAESRRHRLR